MLTGDDLVAFANGELLPYLTGFKERTSGPNTIEYKIGESHPRRCLRLSYCIHLNSADGTAGIT
jgi:hypothetical protein